MRPQAYRAAGTSDVAKPIQVALLLEVIAAALGEAGEDAPAADQGRPNTTS